MEAGNGPGQSLGSKVMKLGIHHSRNIAFEEVSSVAVTVQNKKSALAYDSD